MSGWKIVTRELYEAGRPMRADQFTLNAAASDPATALHQARILGLVESRRHHYTWAWHLTDKGRAWCEGAITVKHVRPMSQGGKRALCATWLAPIAGLSMRQGAAE